MRDMGGIFKRNGFLHLHLAYDGLGKPHKIFFVILLNLIVYFLYFYVLYWLL